MSTEKQNGQGLTPKPDDRDGVNGINVRPVTKTEISYHDGYVEGQRKVKGPLYERERAAETNGLASGLLIGTLLAFSVGSGFAVWAYANRDVPSPAKPASSNPVTIPASPLPSATSIAPAKQTTIIERMIEKPAPPAQIKVIEKPAPPAQIKVIEKPVPPAQVKVIVVPKESAPSFSTVAPAPAASARPSSEQTAPTVPSINSVPAPTNQSPANSSASPTPNPSDRMFPNSTNSPNSQGQSR